MRLTKDGEVLLEEEYLLNPDFYNLVGEEMEEYIMDLRRGYEDRDLLNFLFDDLVFDADKVFDSIDDVGVEDCIDFIKGKFYYHPERSGFEVDRERFFTNVLENLSSGHIDYAIRVKKRDQSYSLSELKECTRLIGEYETDYRYSMENRKKNVELCCDYLSDTVVLGGEEFSFNQRVGKRTEERGFLPAKVIINGEFQEDWGGGVCQVATTLYNAVLLSGMKIEKCTRHTLAPSYVPLSFDAMVSEWSDFSFLNQTSTPVFIQSCADGERVRIRVYGKSDGLTRRTKTVVKKVIRHEEWCEDSTDYKNGYESEGYLLTYKKDELTSQTLIRRDIYKPYKVS
ncbi:MAG: VanW family protein [Clostridia bacterium]|nr:VanW family protein [Clostridia bacterium]